MDKQFLNLITTLAVDYNCGSYGASTYSNNQACQTTASGGASGGLAYTGLDVLVPLAIGIALIATAVVMFIRNTRKKQPQA